MICESDGFEVQVGGVCSYSFYNSSQTDSLYTCGNEGEIEVKSNGSMLSVGGVMGQNTDCPVVDCWNRGGLKIESSAPDLRPVGMLFMQVDWSDIVKNRCTIAIIEEISL